MTTYTWDFVPSFTVFLILVFVSQALAVRMKSLIPMPLIYGLLFMLGFGNGVLPKDMILSANMIAVGTIAFNVLVIHSGTMVNLPMLRQRKNDTKTCIFASLALIAAAGLILAPLFGKGIALLAPGSMIGGGASCAIASRWVLDRNPGISVFPWMVFMFQGLFSVPVVTIALRREAIDLLADFRQGHEAVPKQEEGSQSIMPMKSNSIQVAGEQKIPGTLGTPGSLAKTSLWGFCDKLPTTYKSTAYYLGLIMIAALMNQWLQNACLASLHINGNMSALLIGILLGSLGLLDRAPLFRSDSYGLLLLGLMGLMANTIANNPVGNLIRLFPAVLVSFLVSSAVLILCGILSAKRYHYRPARGIALTMNCMMGFPVNDMLVKNAAAIAQNEQEQGYLTSQLSPLLSMGTMLISNGISIFIVGIMVNFV